MLTDAREEAWVRTPQASDKSDGQTPCSSSSSTVCSKSCDGEAALPQLSSMWEQRQVAEEF